MHSGDPLRAIAALSVLVFHAGTAAVAAHLVFSNPEPYGALNSTFLTLSRGVWIFFALSGYLLSRPFLHWALAGGAKPSVGRYATNRALRIIPAFWVAVVLTAVCLGNDGTTFKGWVATLLFWQPLYPSPLGSNIAQAWTLHSELIFYIVMPIGIFVIGSALRSRVSPKRLALIILGLVSAICIASLVKRAHTPATGRESEQFIAAVNGFCPGVAIAVVEAMWADRFRDRAWAKRLPALLLLASLGFFLGLILLKPADQGLDWLGVAGSGALVAAPLVRQWHGAAPWRLLDLKPLHWIGERSYSVYLLHNIVIGLLVTHTSFQDQVGLRAHWAIIALIALPLTLIASAITYRFVERPFLERRLPWRSDVAADRAAHDGLGLSELPPAPTPLPVDDALPKDAPVRQRFELGDPLRALTALAIFVFHAGAVVIVARQAYNSPEPFGNLYFPYLMLTRSVWLFFALSAYLLARPFLRWALAGGPRPSLKRYTTNRALRLVPAFWVALILTTIFLGNDGTDWKGWIAALAFMQPIHPSPLGQNIIQAWTLHVEVVFYITMPLAVLTFGSVMRGRISPVRLGQLMLVALAGIATASLYYRAGTPTAGHEAEQYVAAVSAFCPGMALAIIEILWGDRFKDTTWARWLAPGLLLLSAACFLSVIPTKPRDQSLDWLGVAGSGLVVAAVLVRQWAGRRPWRALNIKPLHWVGVRTYSFYLLHNLILFKVSDSLLPGLKSDVSIGVHFLLVAVASLPVTLLAAGISYRYIEKPLLERRLPWRADPKADEAAHPDTAGGPAHKGAPA
jgi:peptidoglycan/LPS O-acetylase OafA/YrhL